MKAETFLDKLKRILWQEPLGKIEYFFAKRYLDKTFGKREYWGEYIQELMSHSVSKGGGE